jgi:hypothetical protein
VGLYGRPFGRRVPYHRPQWPLGWAKLPRAGAVRRRLTLGTRHSQEPSRAGRTSAAPRRGRDRLRVTPRLAVQEPPLPAGARRRCRCCGRERGAPARPSRSRRSSAARRRVFDAWAYEHRVTIHFIRPGRPVEYACAESFAKCLAGLRALKEPPAGSANQLTCPRECQDNGTKDGEQVTAYLGLFCGVRGATEGEMRRSFVIAVGALLFLGAAPSLMKSLAGSRGLFVPSGITPAVDRSRANGIYDLEYEVDQAYPASRFIGWIQADLLAQGWSVPALDPLNPHLGSTFVERNWARWTESEKLRDWECEWVNTDAALVRYVLRYTRPSSAKPWSRLKVVAVYWPPAIVAAEIGRAAAGRKK